MATTYSNLLQKNKTLIIYDTAASTPIQGADANHSLIINTPSFIQLEALASGTTIQVQQKIHIDATWVNVGAAITNTDGATIVTFSKSPNYVQLVRSGSGAIKAWRQA